MCRKKRRFFQSILFWISVWILVIGLAGMLMVNFFVRIRMRYQTEKQITEEMLRARDNCLLYVQQILLLNDSRMDAAGFEAYRNEIRDMLESAGFEKVFLCDTDGLLLEGDAKAFLQRREQEDFIRAGNGESSLVVHYGPEARCQVFFSIPVTLYGQFIGTISSFFDYGDLYAGQLSTVERVIWITVAVFAVMCLVIWLTVYRILWPIRRLSSAASEVSAHLADGRQGSMILGGLGLQERRDEIGELASNYPEMLRVIEGQVHRIQEDKDRILALWSSRREFYNNVTHELKTPLTTISGYAQLMEKNGPADQSLFYRGTEHILRESNRLHRMVLQLLELQDKEDREEKKRLDLAETLRSVMEAMEVKAGRYENSLVLEETGSRFHVYGHEDRIRQVFINVIDNAVKYGEPKKPIRIGIEGQGTQIRITVTNQGRGIREDELKIIFEPFYRADKSLSRELGSSGLGLSIAAKIMADHAGTISADSVPGRETVFTICFPVCPLSQTSEEI